VTDAFAAAAEPTRRRILQLLARRPRFVTDLASDFDVTRSAISQHLLVLADAGLVKAEKQGRQRLYRVERDGVRRLQREIELFWTAELDLLTADARELAASRAGSSTTDGEAFA
jgi:DNA-binding transcriptional ArsR family regulator